MALPANVTGLGNESRLPASGREGASMKSRELNDHGEKTWLLVFDKDDEVIATLTGFAKTHAIQAAHFTAIGAFSEVVLGYFERDRKDYTKIPLREQVEVLSLIGDIATDRGTPKVHAHVVVGRADGAAHGGQMLEGRVWPTLELILGDVVAAAEGLHLAAGHPVDLLREDAAAGVERIHEKLDLADRLG